MIVDCAVYRNGRRRPGSVSLEEAFEAGREPDAFVWIGLFEPTAEEFEAVEKEFSLHKLAVEDAVKAHQRPKIEVYEHNVFVVLKTARYVESTESVEFAEIMLFIGLGYVISVRHGQASALSDVRRSVEAKPELLRCGPGAVLHAIVDRVVDDYQPVIDGIDNDIREVEGEVFGEGRGNAAERIYKLKREVLDLIRNTVPLLEPLEHLAAGRLPFNHPELGPFFRDVADHLARVVSRVEDFRAMLTDALDANLAQVTLRQNDDMRKMSAWLAIGAFPTVVGAIYGMNFENMPELSWSIGYPLVLVFTAGICLVLYRRFKRIGWL